MTKPLTASEEFVVGKNNIAYVGQNFKDNLYDLTFTMPAKRGFETKKLERNMFDKDILSDFGPEPVTLGDVLAYLKEAERTGWYIFYVKDSTGTLWAVGAGWHDVGWYVGACSVTDPNEWNAGSVVVSRRLSVPQKNLSDSDAVELRAALEEVDRLVGRGMRTREEIEKDTNITYFRRERNPIIGSEICIAGAQLEVLLDIRDLLTNKST